MGQQVTYETILVALTLLNTAGIIPALWALVRYIVRVEHRLMRLELHAGFGRREGD